MKKVVIIMSVVCGFLSACKEGGDVLPPSHKNYIWGYLEPQGIYCYTGTRRDYDTKIDPNSPNHRDIRKWDIVVGNKTDLSFAEYRQNYGIFGYATNAELSRLYDSICEANNDISFNKWDFFTDPCIHRRIESIHIVSDIDYDAAHPAGAYLDDVLAINFNSAYEFVKSNYSYTAEDYVPGGDMTESLVTFNNKKRNMIVFGFGFNFTKLPDDPNAYRRFTATYINEDGKELTATSGTTQITGLRQ